MKIVPFVLTAALLAVVACGRGAQHSETDGHSHGADGHSHGGSAHAHGDHEAKHGGLFFMAPDGYHHLEGTWTEPGVFRVWLYDDHTRPIDAAPFRGRIVLESDESVSAALVLDPGTRTLVGRFETAPALPVDLALWLKVPGREDLPDGDLFNFSFTDWSREGQAPPGFGPVASGTGGASHGAEGHAHGAPHGGTVVDATGNAHLEFAFHGQLLAIYLLGAEEETLEATGASASVIVQVEGEAARTIQLTAHGDHFMAGEPLRRDRPTVVVATVTAPSGTHLARFSW